MRLLDGGDTWTFSTSDDADVEFCVWTLLRDGLQVPPFDRHPTGDGALRAEGMTAEAWRAWLTAAVSAVAGADGRRRADGIEREERHYREHRTLPTSEQYREWGMQTLRRMSPPSPLAHWTGGDRLGRALADLHGDYMSARRERRNREGEELLRRRATSAGRLEQGERSKRLWDAIQRYRPLPPLHFYRVDYLVPVLAVVPPDAAVLGGIPGIDHAHPAYETLVLRGAAELAGR